MIEWEARAKALEKALRKACEDGWADGDGAFRKYLRDVGQIPLTDVPCKPDIFEMTYDALA